MKPGPLPGVGGLRVQSGGAMEILSKLIDQHHPTRIHTFPSIVSMLSSVRGLVGGLGSQCNQELYKLAYPSNQQLSLQNICSKEIM